MQFVLTAFIPNKQLEHPMQAWQDLPIPERGMNYLAANQHPLHN